MITPRECQEIFGTVMRAARARGVSDVELMLGESAEALTRFANNAIHQNVAERSRSVSVRVIVNQRTARASTNVLDPASLQAAVASAIEIARSLEPDPDLLPLPEPAPIPALDRRFAGTASCPPEDRARVVAEAIRAVEAESQTAAGIYSTEEHVEALYNSNGIAAFHTETLARFSITAMGGDRSGWAKASSTHLNAFCPIDLARRAARKAALSREPREIPPGRYTVILEPAAVLDLVGQIFADFSATAVADQRSFLNGRAGQALFAPSIHITDDVFHPLQSGAAYDGEGVPRRRLSLVEGGIPRDLTYSRLAAHRAGVEPTGHGFALPNETGEMPVNLVIHGGDETLDSLIASTGRGILVTRLWYIREVDPYEKIMTGMTRDGTFLIEDGKITAGLRNFRFNQSVIEMLRNVEAMTREERASGEETFDMVVPAMKVPDFNFTEVTKF